MAFDATIGGTSSNSYGTLEEADSYFEDRPEAAAWNVLSANQEGWLIAATDRLEQLTYQGDRTTSTQALSWPRANVVVDGVLLDDWEIPARLKRSQFTLALLLAEESESRLADGDLDAFERLKVDVIELVPRKVAESGEIPDYVTRELLPLLGTGSMYQFRIARG